MATETSLGNIRTLGIASLVFGILGGVFYWWTPLGMVLSLTGLIMGIVAWLNATPRTGSRSMAIAGTLLSAATFVLDLVIALLGLELIQLMSYH